MSDSLYLSVAAGVGSLSAVGHTPPGHPSLTFSVSGALFVLSLSLSLSLSQSMHLLLVMERNGLFFFSWMLVFTFGCVIELLEIIVCFFSFLGCWYLISKSGNI
jgi:hypothetical protein